MNLIRKILLKDFTFCDSAVDISSIEEAVPNVHLRNCKRNSNLRLPKNSILSNVYNAQLLVKENFGHMEVLDNLKESQSQCQDREKILQHYRVGSTALDCSLMITLQKLWENVGKWVWILWQDNVLAVLFDFSETSIDRNHLVAMNDTDKVHHFVVNPTIVDLDIKKDSLDHFQKYKKQCQESKLAFLDFMRQNFKWFNHSLHLTLNAFWTLLFCINKINHWRR